MFCCTAVNGRYADRLAICSLNCRNDFRYCDCISVLFAIAERLNFHTEHSVGDIVFLHTAIFKFKYVLYSDIGLQKKIITHSAVFIATLVFENVFIYSSTVCF